MPLVPLENRSGASRALVVVEESLLLVGLAPEGSSPVILQRRRVRHPTSAKSAMLVCFSMHPSTPQQSFDMGI